MAKPSESKLRAKNEELRAENDELRLRLEESEQALEAIRTGQVESLVVDGPDGPRIFSLEGAAHSYRVLVESMNEGAVTFSQDGTILYCNAQLARMLGLPLQTVMGSSLREYIPEHSRDRFDALLERARESGVREELSLRAANGDEIPAYLSVSSIVDDGRRVLCLVATDLREQRRSEAIASAERAARASEERLRLALHAGEGGTWDFDLATQHAWWSPEMYEMFGVQPGTGIHFEESLTLIHEEDRNRVARAVERSIQRREDYRCEFRIRHPLRGERWITSQGRVVCDESGKPVRMHGINFDVTERKRAEDALRESQGRLRSVLDNSLDCIYRIDLRTGRYDYVSPAALRFLGYSAEELLSQDVDTALATIHPDDLAAVQAAMAHLEESGQCEAEYRQQARSGEWRWLSNRMSLMKDDVGRPRYRDGTIRDITERKRAEAELAIITRLYAVLSRVNEAIVRIRDERRLYEEVCRVVAEDGGFPLVWVGLVEARDVTPVASAGRETEYLREIKVEVEGDLSRGPTGTAIREGRPVINDDFGENPSTRPWREASRRHGLRASASFPMRRSGKVIGAMTFYSANPGAFTAVQVRLLEALCADLSYALDAADQERLRAEAERALRESEQSLRDADRRKDEFLGMLSHELRNPLAPIRNSTYILRHAEAGSEQAQRAQTVIERQSQHLTRLVDDLLDVTRIARGKIGLRRARSDIREIVRRTAEDFRSVVENRGVAFHVEVPATQVWADVDVTRLGQAIGNLLQNAAKFTRQGDSVTLSLESDGTNAHMRVVDTGVGIDAQLLPRIFNAFVQGERTLARSEGGLGLGLALVKGIVELHGGTVSAESSGAGQGAQFTIRLPAATVPELLRPAASKAHAFSGRRVLVVDDNVDAAESLAETLRIAGHEVEVAFDGPSAIEKVRIDPPDVVLCDIGLPGMTGYDVARRLRASCVDGMQLIAVSGYAQPEDVMKAVEAGFDGLIAKPCDPEQIERLLE